MNLLPVALPSAPDWRLDWQALHDQFEWIRAMQGCPQDPIHHAEGDVWIHVRMVCEALLGLDEWRSLPEHDRNILFAAALLHDVAKPQCTRTEQGRITSRGHSQRGAIQARRILWNHEADFGAREQVCALIRYHQFPFYLIDRQDPLRSAALISQTARCDLLTILATADALGRHCHDQAGLLTRVALFRDFCEEQQCLQQPKAFASALSRFEYFRMDGRDAHYAAYDQSRCEVVLLAGLPGAGKDTWIAQQAGELPVISLDDIRGELNADPTGKQGPVIQAAKVRARTLLRQGTGFVWNATNLSREVRTQLVDLFTAYQARVRMVYVEAPPQALLRQNRERAAVVPESALERMLDRWEVPDPVEAPRVEWMRNHGVWESVELYNSVQS